MSDKPETPVLGIEAEMQLLTDATAAFEKMPSEARNRAFKYLKDLYSKDWPYDTY